MCLFLEIDSLNGDSDFYLNVANNLNNRCGFSFTNLITVECEILYDWIVSVCFILISFLLFFGADLKNIYLFYFE